MENNILEQGECSECGQLALVCSMDDDMCRDCFKKTHSKCANCNNYYLNEDMIDHEGDMYCEDCFNDTFSMCDSCNNIVYSDDITYVNDTLLCDRCLNESYNQCAICGEYVHSDNTHYVNDENYCENCFFDNYTYCLDCGEPIYNDNIRYNDTTDEYYCEDCYNAINNNISLTEALSNNTIYSYTTKAKWTFHKQPWENTLFMGLELE